MEAKHRVERKDDYDDDDDDDEADDADVSKKTTAQGENGSHHPP